MLNSALITRERFFRRHFLVTGKYSKNYPPQIIKEKFGQHPYLLSLRDTSEKDRLDILNSYNSRKAVDWERVSIDKRTPFSFLLENSSHVDWIAVLKWLDWNLIKRHLLLLFLLLVKEYIPMYFALLLWAHYIVPLQAYYSLIMFYLLLFAFATFMFHLAIRYNPTLPLEYYRYSGWLAVKRILLLKNPNIPFEECVKGIIRFENSTFWHGTPLNKIIRKFLETHNWREIFTHPFFSKLNKGVPGVLSLYRNLPLPLEFYDRFFGERDYRHLFTIPTLPPSFWEEHWREIPRDHLLHFLKDCPVLTLNFIVEYLEEIRQLLPRDENDDLLILTALARNRWSTQTEYEKFEHVIQRAKRKFLHKYYSPYTELGRKRLTREYHSIK